MHPISRVVGALGAAPLFTTATLLIPAKSGIATLKIAFQVYFLWVFIIVLVFDLADWYSSGRSGQRTLTTGW